MLSIALASSNHRPSQQEDASKAGETEEGNISTGMHVSVMNIDIFPVLTVLSLPPDNADYHTALLALEASTVITHKHPPLNMQNTKDKQKKDSYLSPIPGDYSIYVYGRHKNLYTSLF